MLRFAFMDRTVGEARTIEFLEEFGCEIQGYLPSLSEFLEVHASEMALSVTAGLGERRSGVRNAAALVEGFRAQYRERKGNQV